MKFHCNQQEVEENPLQDKKTRQNRYLTGLDAAKLST